MPCPGSPGPGTPATHPGPLVIRGTVQGAQANQTADRRNWKMESIKRRAFKMMVEMNANKERYCSDLI